MPLTLDAVCMMSWKGRSFQLRRDAFVGLHLDADSQPIIRILHYLGCLTFQCSNVGTMCRLPRREIPVELDVLRAGMVY